VVTYQKAWFFAVDDSKSRHKFLNGKKFINAAYHCPVCTGSTSLDVSNMKDGDFAGFALLQKNYGLVGVRVEGNNKTIVMINATGGKPVEAQTIPLNQKTVFFKAECDFTDKKDVANFFYSLDGKTWTPIGTQLKMAYTLPHFMGYRFTLFNYATKNVGGSADFDFFHITDTISKKN